ncbi:glycosyltransferase family 2 protein [Rhodococcus opacus]|uniref:glycosyltransferase family 2 protein n=1 Tax=Rhodococcus opacus TaxID=37919 RepID=UPI002263F24C|nr:glycosyltransferase family 2 protein [Rhodococcus opacus]MDX5962965.1 glycosyltransferase family 2 protein [Rhodococcus opacus]
MTTKNRKEELERSLLSARLLRPVPKILVIDDGSTDGTSAMVKELFPEVHLISCSESAGLIARRNQLARECGTKYLASIDDDAYFQDSTTLQAGVEHLEASPSVAVVALPYINVKISDDVLQLPAENQLSCELGAYTGTAHIIRVDTFLELGGYPDYLIRQGEESFYSLLAMNAGRKVEAIHAVPLHHHHSPIRDNEKIVFYARRNEVISALLLWPVHMLPNRIARLTARLIRSIASTRLVKANVSGFLAGVFAGGIKMRADRRPVKPATIKTHLRLLALDRRRREQG